MTMTTNQPELSPELSDKDYNALKICISRTLKDRCRIEQVQSMFADRPWIEVALFCCYVQQINSLALKPWETPPMDVDLDSDKEEHATILTRRLIDAGLSIYEADPLMALSNW
jgi:hypothetical protein